MLKTFPRSAGMETDMRWINLTTQRRSSRPASVLSLSSKKASFAWIQVDTVDEWWTIGLLRTKKSSKMRNMCTVALMLTEYSCHRFAHVHTLIYTGDFI